VVGFVGAYFWQTIDVLAVAGLAVRAYPVARAEFESDARRRASTSSRGVATALTPIAFFETVMVRSYGNLVDSDTRVDVNTGIVAAGRLQSLIDSRD
jgi:hypothetical protein